MKRYILIIFLFLFSSLQVFAVDYSKSENWVINSSNKLGTQYDVFYIYPTLFKTEKPSLFDWKNPDYNQKAKRFAKAQTSIFDDKKVRVFAPFVRQVDLITALSTVAELKKENFDYKSTLGKYAIEDARDALVYYLKNYNSGRPFVLL